MNKRCVNFDGQTASFFVVWNPAGRNPQHRHTNSNDAIAEAERLARENPDQQFFVLEAISVSTKPKDEITKRFLQEKDIPF